MKKLGEVLLFILSGIAKTVSYLMVTLGLWLPSLFVVSFFVTVAVVHAPLSSKVMAVFYGGLAFTLAAGIGLAMVYAPSLKKRRAEKKLKENQKLRALREKAQAEASAPREDFTATAPQPEPMRPVPVTREERPQPTPLMQQSAVSASVTPSFAPPADDYSDLERKYFSTERRESAVENEFGDEAKRLWERLSGAEIPDEQPLVFRTRSDENVFVYEYSDRYQFWRRTGAGMLLERTQYKTKKDEAADPVRRQR